MPKLENLKKKKKKKKKKHLQNESIQINLCFSHYKHYTDIKNNNKIFYGNPIDLIFGSKLVF